MVYHEVHSVAKLIEVFEAAAAYGVSTFVVSRAQGAAAQSGIPDISVRAWKKGIRLLVVNDLPEAIDILKPSKVLVLSGREGREVREGEIDENTMVVVTGTEPDTSKRDTYRGEVIRVTPAGLGEVGRLVTVLCKGMMRPTSNEG